MSLAVPQQLGSWRWLIAGVLATVLAVATMSAVLAASSASSAPVSASPASGIAGLAESHPQREIEVIAQFDSAISDDAARQVVQSAGGEVIRDLPIISGYGVRIEAAAAQELTLEPGLTAVSLNAAVEKEGLVDPAQLETAFNQSIRSPRAWAEGYTGQGVGVAVVDTGIAGNLPDFRVSRSDARSRVVASAVVNPGATTAGDSYGHGTHIAGLIAGNGTNRPLSDPLRGRYAGVAPDANLIDVKVSDENGNASVLDVIDGLQFVVDHEDLYNIRVVNLSLRSTNPESYLTDPLDAAVEAAWNQGIVVVTAAGNAGASEDAVSYAPANDPYVITVGGVDDMQTRTITDDVLAPWSSRGVTQDGYSKPDILAPGAKLVSTIAPGSEYTRLCPSCVVDGSYFQVGGSSMAAALVSGEAALLIEANPSWTPNQIKAQLIRRTRPVYENSSSSAALVDGLGNPVEPDATISTVIIGGEAAADRAIFRDPVAREANRRLQPNLLLDPATGLIDWNRASWSRASWSEATDPLRASWSRASWSRASWSRASWSASPASCTDFERASWSRASWSATDIQMAKDQCSTLLAEVDPTRASWSRASWSRASWSSSFNK